MATRVAAIDCGTNSVRLLVADADGGVLTDIDRHMRMVRLGQGVDKTGELAPEAIERTLVALKEYQAVIEQHGVSRDAVRFVATSASRDASNAHVFQAGVSEILGVEPEVIAGDEEAALSFRGATCGLEGGKAPYLVVDLGGGSTEFVVGDTSVEGALSTDMGSVRVTERFFASDPPTAAQVDAATAFVDEVVGDALRSVGAERVATVIGVAGSITTLAAYSLGLEEYEKNCVHAAQFSADEVKRSCASMLALSHAERSALGSVSPGRVDVIAAGALIWSRIVAQVEELAGVGEVRISEHDILDGIALSVADRCS